MSNQFKPLNQLTKDEIQELINACISFDPGNILGSGYKESEVSFYSAPKFGWEWDSKKKFTSEIKAVTGAGSITEANKVLEKQLTKAPQQPAATTPGALGEQQAAELAAQETALKEAKEKGIKDTQEFLRQQQERAERLKEILKSKELRAKVDPKEPEVELPKEQAEAISKLKEEAVQNQKAVTEQLAEEIKVRIEKDTPPEVLDVVAKQTAYDAVQALQGDIETSPVIQAAYFQAVASNPAVVEKVVQDPEIAKEVAKTAADLANSKISQLELSKQIFGQAFGNDAAKAVFGEKFISISETAVPGYTQAFSLSQIPAYHTQNLSDQNSLLNDVKNLGVDEAKARIGSHFGSLIEKRIASLPEGHFLRSEFVSNTLGVFGVGAPVKWVVAEGASPIIKFAVSSGYGPFLGAVQSATGWSLGISKVAAPVVEKAAAGVAAKTGLKAAISALGLPGGPVGVVLAWIGTEILGKLISKVGSWLKRFISKHKEDLAIAGALLFGGGALLRSIPLMAAGGLLAAPGLLGGMTLAGVGAGIGNFFWTLGRAIAITIGTPILVTLLVFPVVVALILFIINSGAYIVPPSPLSLNLGGFSSPYVDLKKTANPPGPFSNSDFPKEITYTITIKPKKGNLGGVQLSYDCQVISRASVSCPSIEIEDKYKDIFTKPIDTVSATGLTFTYKSTYTNQFKDSAIVDSIKLNAVSAVDNNQVSTEVSAESQFGTPPISCPILGGHTVSPQYNFSLNQANNTGHGSRAYWQAMRQSPSSYALPQQSGCHSVSDCSYYGYAYDVFPPGSRDVYAPTILGKDVTWNCSYGFINRSSGNTYICAGGGYALVLTHMAKGAKTGNVKSGEKIGTLYNQIGNTHLHIEFQINGRYVKPENYFCGGK